MTKPTFDFIGNYPEHIPLVAKWHQDEWHNISPNLTTELRIKLYSSYPTYPNIPCSIIALLDGVPAGSASLVESDMETHPHLHPWLASVYVDKKYRCQGLATQLITNIIDTARSLDIKKLYLFTPDQAYFYKQRGWKLIENYTYNGENVDIMSFEITSEDT